MKRFRPDRPADICFARGTFNAHPYVMGAMSVFLDRVEEPAIQTIYQGLDELWNGRAAQLNARLAAEDLPVAVANLSSIGRSTTRSRRAITGCCNIICGPRGLRSVGSAPGG